MEFLQFTLGPVQSFVAQARRTRDFWAGSFLLSYLVGKAMLAVIEAGGRIVFPIVQKEDGTVEDQLLKAIKESPDDFKGKFPGVGSLPNRFLAEVPKTFAGDICVKAVKSAWQAIAEDIWRKYIVHTAALGRKSEAIWRRQVESFWEMNWVFGDRPDLLDRRKNWRNHLPPPEPGDKCSLMANWQELSGYIRVSEWKEQDKFWEVLSKNSPGQDLCAGERLCSIALIKRLFPHLLGQKAVSYPSTSYLAAVPWLREIIADRKQHEYARDFERVADTGFMGHENPERFFDLESLDPGLQKFVSLGGTCYFASTLENDELWPKDGTRKRRDEMKKLLGKFEKQPSPFYGLLLMDGDRLGALLGDEGRRIEVSQAIAAFSREAEPIVKNYTGVTVYAGGDDVLALLPWDQVLPAATALRDCYLQAFFGMEREREKATISAAIVYAHHHAPLRQVIARAHKILDEEAKEKTGRDALAVAVWKTGGAVLGWSAPWEVRDSAGGPEALGEVIKALTADLRQKHLTNSWIYNIRKLLGNPRENEFEIPAELDLPRLLTAELLKSREAGLDRAKAEAAVQRLLTLCARQRRDENGTVKRDDRTFRLDGALLMKFLTAEGVEA